MLLCACLQEHLSIWACSLLCPQITCIKTHMQTIIDLPKCRHGAQVSSTWSVAGWYFSSSSQSKRDKSKLELVSDKLYKVGCPSSYSSCDPTKISNICPFSTVFLSVTKQYPVKSVHLAINSNHIFNGNSKILKWRYHKKAIFRGYIPYIW